LSTKLWSTFFFQAEDGIRDFHVTGVQTCALPILPVVIFMCLHDPNPCETKIVERSMVSTSPKAVQPVDHHRIHVGHVIPGNLMNISGKLSGNPIYFSAIKAAHFSFFFSFGRWYGF